jgi:hypothetical protein
MQENIFVTLNAQIYSITNPAHSLQLWSDFFLLTKTTATKYSGVLPADWQSSKQWRKTRAFRTDFAMHKTIFKVWDSLESWKLRKRHEMDGTATITRGNKNAKNGTVYSMHR